MQTAHYNTFIICLGFLLFISCEGYRLPRTAKANPDKRYECVWHTKDTGRRIDSKHYEDEQNYTIEDCRSHNEVASVRCDGNYRMLEKCYCGHEKLRKSYCTNVRAKFDCTKCRRDGCLNGGKLSKENTECKANENKLKCDCNTPHAYKQYHGSESPFRGDRCEKVYEHRRCKEVNTIPNDSIQTCNMATQYDNRCKLTIGKTYLLCKKPLKNITEVKEPQHCRDIVSERESEEDEEEDIAIHTDLKASSMTQWGNVAFNSGELQLQARVVCRTDVPIAEMDESRIEHDCFVMKVNIRYCDNDGKCGKRLGGIRKLFDTLK